MRRVREEKNRKIRNIPKVENNMKTRRVAKNKAAETTFYDPVVCVSIDPSMSFCLFPLFCLLFAGHAG